MEKKNLLNVIKKVSFSLFTVIIYVIGLYIPLPFAEVTKQYMEAVKNTPISILGAFSGANFTQISIFSIGLNPLMFSMLIIQLLSFTHSFGFDALSPKQVQYLMQFLTMIITIIQAALLVFAFTNRRNGLEDFEMILILSAGSCLVVWLCYRNMKYGVGASAPVILTSILNGAIPNIISNVKLLLTMKYAWVWLAALAIFILLLIKFWLAFTKAYYPLKVVNPSLPASSNLMTVPLGLNMAAMMMYMVGMAILTLPLMVGRYFSSSSLINNWVFQASFSAVMGILIFYFFTFVNFDPKEQAKSFRNNHYYIPNIAPGRPTQRYLNRLIWIIAFPGAVLNAFQLVFGLYGGNFLGNYAGFAIIPMNVVMITMFMGGIKDQIDTILFPYRYDRLLKDN